MTKREGIVLVTEQQAERELLADGFVKVPCAACEGRGFWTLGEPPNQGKFCCDKCEGAKWTWRSPPAKTSAS